MIAHVSLKSASHLPKCWYQYTARGQGVGRWGWACTCRHVCIQQERADGYADKALFTGLPETRPATARKGQKQSRSSSNPEPKGGLQALLQVVTWVSGRAVPYLPTRSAALPRHFCPRATHRPFTLETKYHWGTTPRRAWTGALRQLTKGKHKRTCNC